jgi:EAL domain-containing protein (putative c-di-GMP-specific phosphodiesterase class I)/GGDEF domain-containing protein
LHGDQLHKNTIAFNEGHPLRANEEARVSALHNLRLLDSAPTKAFDRITRIASQLLQVPISSISLMDKDRQVFKSRVGFDLLEAPRQHAPCHWALQSKVVYTVPDMLEDPRFSHTSIVRNGGIRSYAGAPLITRTGYSLGTLCVMDKRPRTFSECETVLLTDLADMAMSQIELQNSIGRIHPVSGYPNEYQLIDDLDDLSARAPAASRTALMVELVSARQMQDGVRVLGANFVENLIHSSTITIRRSLDTRAQMFHVGAARCVVLLDETSQTTWPHIVRQLHRDLRQPIDTDGIPIRAEPAIGVHSFMPGETKSRDVLRRLYSAVDDARGEKMLTACYDESHDRRHMRRFQLLASLRSALQATDQLALVYQPRVDLDGRPRGVEALLRWHDPQHGDISPAEFVPLAEETALIGTLTQWVLERAIAQAARWRRAGYRLKVSINVSAPNLEDANFAEGVAHLLAHHDLSPSAIELEFTESVLARDDQRVIGQLCALRDMGIEIAIDDFGTGYSNLAYLQKLPATILKIDRTFIKDLATSERDRKLVCAMIGMAHELGYRVVAEGIETEECVTLLKSWGCDEAQGYFFSRPVPATGIESWLNTNR